MNDLLNIALPKGRLGDKVYNLLESIGYDCREIREDGRKLVFENPATGVRYLLVKPSDVAIYVEHGAADVGIVGKDILEESRPDLYELLDLGIGRCRTFLVVLLLITIGQWIIVEFGGEVFRTVPLTWQEWAWIIGLTSLIAWGGEAVRAIGRRRNFS